MSLNTFGHLFRVTTWGESHGPALGATVDGCPPGVPIDAGMIQHWLDRRKPGQNRYTTQRREPDEIKILSGVVEGQTTGTPVQLMIENTDQRSKDYGEIADRLRDIPAGWWGVLGAAALLFLLAYPVVLEAVIRTLRYRD